MLCATPEEVKFNWIAILMNSHGFYVSYRGTVLCWNIGDMRVMEGKCIESVHMAGWLLIFYHNYVHPRWMNFRFYHNYVHRWMCLRFYHNYVHRWMCLRFYHNYGHRWMCLRFYHNYMCIDGGYLWLLMVVFRYRIPKAPLHQILVFPLFLCTSRGFLIYQLCSLRHCTVLRLSNVYPVCFWTS